MAYGYAIYDEQGREITGLLTPVFFLDRITSPSGSITYANQPPGKTLKANFIGIMSWRGSPMGAPNISISGNTITWSNLNGGESSYIYTYWG